ncbi:flagellar hook-associated protein FlgK [Kamptonema cortianum]|nr:flagellar hook-associated protein FlgK [Geitlerinema splendidum]MDK3161087.1 flagellar hook-associated protein FlgK [Kamptonema cortianum]
MAGPFAGLNMTSLALRGFQRAMDTTGHNIANVNTRGYSRQTVEFGTLPPLNFYNFGQKSVGQGSFITSINRIRDHYIETSLNNATGNQGKYSQFAAGFRRIDAIYGEPSDSGIAQSLDRFFNAWSGLGSNPGDPAALAEVRMSGQVLTDRVRGKYRDLLNFEAQTTSSVNNTVDRINNLAGQIATLNKQIQQAIASNGTPNDLLDQRELAIRDLSKLVNVSRETFPDGTYAVYAGGFTLVQGSAARPFPTSFDATAGTFTDGSITYNIRGGELAGLLGTLNEVNTQKTNLDSLANELRTQINTPHMTGTNALGNTNVRFFNDVLTPPQTGAIDFDLSVDVKADARAIAAGLSGDPGDGSLAKLFAEMRGTQFAAIGNKSFSDFFQGIYVKLAADTNYYMAADDTEKAVVAQIENQRQSVAGVNLDDEMANLVKFQRSYQAAARALTVFDQTAEDLINILRR